MDRERVRKAMDNWNCRADTQKFSERLRKLREAQEMKQSDLAKVLCVTRSCISNYENGTRYPDFEIIKRAADYFDVFVDYLMGTSDYVQFPIKREELDSYREFSKNISIKGEKIDLSGIPAMKKLMILEFSKYVMSYKEDEKIY